MSGQAGFFVADPTAATPVGVADLLLQGIERRGPDDAGTYESAGLVIVARLSHANRADTEDHQPRVSASGHVLTWDGRLDDRAALGVALGMHRRIACDSELVLRAYERWGVQAFEKLLGDWSLAVWNPADRSVVLASDYLGTRPLYYCLTRDAACWSSNLETLVHLKDCADDLDPRFIAGFMVLGAPPQMTPYRGIFSVPAGEYVQLRANDVKTQRFWSFPHGELRYRREAEYSEHLRHVVTEGVASRLRVAGRAWAELSGGWDSSVIVCVASELINSGTVEADTLRTVSYVNPSGPESDERPFIKAVEEHCGLTGHHLFIDPSDCLPSVDWVTPHFIHPINAQASELVRSQGGRVILTGRLGDSIMGSFADLSPSLADYLQDGRLLTYGRMARQWSRATRTSIWRILRNSTSLLWPGKRQEQSYQTRMLRRGSTATMATNDLRGAFCIDPSLVAGLDGLYPDLSDQLKVARVPSKRIFLRPLIQYGAYRQFLYPDQGAYVEYSHPLTDARVVRFILEVPTDVLCKPGVPRALMRNAFMDLLPDRIKGRWSKGYAAPGVGRNLRPLAVQWLERIDRLRVVQAGYVDAESLRQRLTQCAAGAMPFGRVQRIIALERWLEARDGRRRQPWTSTVSQRSLQSIPTRKEVKAHAL